MTVTPSAGVPSVWGDPAGGLGSSAGLSAPISLVDLRLVIIPVLAFVLSALSFSRIGLKGHTAHGKPLKNGKASPEVWFLPRKHSLRVPCRLAVLCPCSQPSGVPRAQATAARGGRTPRGTSSVSSVMLHLLPPEPAFTVTRGFWAQPRLCTADTQWHPGSCPVPAPTWPLC